MCVGVVDMWGVYSWRRACSALWDFSQGFLTGPRLAFYRSFSKGEMEDENAKPRDSPRVHLGLWLNLSIKKAKNLISSLILKHTAMCATNPDYLVPTLCLYCVFPTTLRSLIALIAAQKRFSLPWQGLGWFFWVFVFFFVMFTSFF